MTASPENLSRRRRGTSSFLILGALVMATLGGYGVYSIMGGGTSGGAAWGTKVGLSITRSHEIAIHVLTCPGERVVDITLGVSDSSFSSVRSTLWEIRSASGSTVSDYVAGHSYEGFVTTTSLTSDPGLEDYLVVEVTTHGNGGGFAADFQLRDLNASTIFVDGPGLLGKRAHVDGSRFESVRDHVCELQQRGPGG